MFCNNYSILTANFVICFGCQLVSLYIYYFHTQDTGDAPIHIAVRRNDIELAKLLLESGTPIDLQNVSLCKFSISSNTC